MMRGAMKEDERDARWAQIQNDRGIGFPPMADPTRMMVPMCSGLRIRREANSRDDANSRIWDSFRATPPLQISSDDLKIKNGPVYMDMNPTASRTSNKQYRNQPEYMPGNALPPNTNSVNPYLQRLDTAGADARNVMRELRGAVSEDNRERDVEASRRMAERQFSDRWLPPQAADDMASLQAYELLRPKQYSDGLD
jgi:hypothetical protein